MTEKRKEEDSDSDSDIGPQPLSANPADPVIHKQKKRKVLQHEKIYLDNLPTADMYEKSLMHREIVNFVSFSKTDFLITTSIDGHVKFWKKAEIGIEFVKHYRAHLGAVVAIDCSPDGKLLATVSVDKAIKIFDIENFDMINIIKLDYLPNTLCWVYKQGQSELLLACSDKESPSIHLYNGKGDEKPLVTIQTLHSLPVHIIKFNEFFNSCVSIDEGGMVEYWDTNLSNELGFSIPGKDKISWSFKGETDLYDFKKAKTVPSTLTFSPDYQKFATFGFGDRQIRIFNYQTGKLHKKIDESLTAISAIQTATATTTTDGVVIDQHKKLKLEDMEFGRRLAVERDIEKHKNLGQSLTMNLLFDETGNFLIYPTIFGIKVVNLVTNRLDRVIGKEENQRFMNLAIYQGAPKKKALLTMAMAASENALVKEAERRDPTIFCTSYKKNRFYLFSQREPETTLTSQSSGRDIFNEKPSREEQTIALTQTVKPSLGTSAILHTTLGDIHLKLFPEYAPKAVENFIELSKKGYYNDNIFHRCIKSFMIQTGDPTGSGTGGESIYGFDFEDEFHKAVKHDRPYTLSMANCGPGTNASQFFITTAATPWLDNKHTIFGRATGGMDVIHQIETVEKDKQDKPRKAVKIMGIDVR